MNWEQMENTFYNCLDFCEVYGRTPYFYITGGDPILHPDFWRLLELIKEHDIKLLRLYLYPFFHDLSPNLVNHILVPCQTS